MTIQAQRNRSEHFKIISVYTNKAISSDRRYLRQIATVAFNLRTWVSDTQIGIILSATESIRIVCNLLFENQLFGYTRYCTEISEININLLPNTCNFYCKFRFIFCYISLRMPKMCILEKLNFKISQGSMPPDPPPPVYSCLWHLMLFLLD